MKHKLIWVIFAIIFTNVLTFAIVKVYFPTTKNNNHYYLKMKGQGEHWSISDYNFIWLPDSGARNGGAIVTYLGNTKKLKGTIQVEVLCYYKGGLEPESIFYCSPEGLENNSFETGGGGSYPDKSLNPMDIVNGTNFLIKWQTKDGKEHEEYIQMELDFNPRVF